MDPTPEKQALILTDSDPLARTASGALAACGFRASTTSDVEEALTHLESGTCALVLADLDLGPSDPTAFLLQAQQCVGPDRLLLLVSEQSIDRVLDWDEWTGGWFLKKPVGGPEVRLAVKQVERLTRRANLDRETVVYGSSPEIQSVLKIVAQAASGNAHVMITGEPGTGKRLIGRAIHERSARAEAPFMQFNATGMSESIAEGELFGSDQDLDGRGLPWPGCLVSCRGGTLLIDAIEALPAGVQMKLFDFLKRPSKLEGDVGETTRGPDVRVIALSVHTLETWVDEGTLHPGLAGLLGGIRIAVPPLRDHKSDIPILVDRFSRRAARRRGQTLKGIAPDALASLMRYNWSGNVRELENLIEYAVPGATDTLLRLEDLPPLPELESPVQSNFRPGATIQEIEREAILATLESTGGSTGRAAQILRMSVRKIQYKLKEYREQASVVARSEKVRSVGAPPQTPAPKRVFVAGVRNKS